MTPSEAAGRALHRIEHPCASPTVWDDIDQDARDWWTRKAQPIADALLASLLTDEALEQSRKIVEDELIEWRDEGRFMLRNNGLTIRQVDGSGSEIIRFGFEMGMRLAINKHIAVAKVP